ALTPALSPKGGEGFSWPAFFCLPSPPTGRGQGEGGRPDDPVPDPRDGYSDPISGLILRMVKRVLWIILAVGIAAAGAWGYGELVRRENDSGQPVRLLAVAEEQSLALSFS